MLALDAAASLLTLGAATLLSVDAATPILVVGVAESSVDCATVVCAVRAVVGEVGAMTAEVLVSGAPVDGCAGAAVLVGGS